MSDLRRSRRGAFEWIAIVVLIVASWVAYLKGSPETGAVLAAQAIVLLVLT